ncbi:MlaD family protein [Tropicimonas sp. IMCC6043]|uniref:MlaD family protein n=1 Tax=Tropicimonas sp. IMCC6043 TaxID=2510645 RepID=UPI00101E0921|nr:MlaD family protein [Tropicimonas sp. IMCC6043]RYH08948.1 MCE family protein [Tropicimonas sp. IMCC6043]
MTDQIPDIPVQPAKRSLMQRVSIVWVVPLAALLIALGIAWQAYSNRGALIEISFQNASGIVAEQTQLRYREVSVGIVEKVTFSDDLSSVVAHVRLDKAVEPFVDSEALFWVVQPQVSARGVSGLETVLSGVYIEGSWDNIPGGLHQHFTGLPERPVARPDQKGTRIVLSSVSGKGLSEGGSVFFKGLEVGRIGRPTLSPDGITIEAEAFINAPHDRLLTTQSRFWNASGISFNLGPTGASVNVESIASLISGGISFETVVSGGDPVTDGVDFTVFGSQDEARENLFEGTGPEGGQMEMAMVFDQNVTGLQVGAQVMLNGLQIGEVVGITGRVDPEQFGDDRVRLVAVLSIDLGKLEAAPEADGTEERREAVLDFFVEAVADGWRAKLARTGLLSSALRIEITQEPDAAPAVFQRDAEPYPIFPSVTTDLKATGASAESLMKRVSDLPIEDLLASAKQVLDNAAKLISSEDMQQIPGDIRGTVEEIRGAVGDARGVIGSADIQALPARLTGIADEIGGVLEEVRQGEAVAKLTDAIEKAGDAASEIGTAAEGVPELLDKIEAVAAKAGELDLEGLLAQAEGLVDSARAVIDTESARALPDKVVAAIDGVESAVGEASSLFAELNSAKAADALAAALESVNAAAEEITTVAEGLPELLTKVEAVADKATALDIEGLLAQVKGLAGSAREVLDTDGARALPDTMVEALKGVESAVGEATTLLADMNEAGAAETLTQALDKVNAAAGDVETAVADLPALIEDFRKVAENAAQMDLATLSEEVTRLVESADALIGTEAARELPGALSAAFDEVGAALSELREGGTVENVNAALASAEKAADSVSQAATDLPELVRRAEATLREAELALAGLSDSGALNRQAQATMRDVSRAADSVRSLMRTLERKPNALLTGK